MKQEVVLMIQPGIILKIFLKPFFFFFRCESDLISKKTERDDSLVEKGKWEGQFV